MTVGKSYALAVASITVGSFAAFVWPTEYRYDHINFNGTVLPIRIQRLNGATDILYTDGWKREAATDPNILPLPKEQLWKLDDNANISSGHLLCELYNGSSFRVNEITVHVEVTDPEQRPPVINRDYKLKQMYFIDPFETGVFGTDVWFNLGANQKWTCYIKSAAGTRE